MSANNTENIKTQDQSQLMEQLKGLKHDFNGNMLNALLSAVEDKAGKLSDSRDNYYKILRKYRNNYLVNGIYDILMNDIYISLGSTDPLSVEIPTDKDAEESVKEMFERTNFIEILQSITPDLLHYGSYPLSIDRDDSGVVGIYDDLEPQDVIPVCRSDNFPVMYLINTGAKTAYSRRNRYEYRSNLDILNFTLDLDYIKLDLDKSTTATVKNKIKSFSTHKVTEVNPDSSKQVKSDETDDSKKTIDELLIKELQRNTIKFRASKSFIWPAFDKIKEALIHSRLGVYRNISTLISPTLVGIPVPDSTEVNELVEIVKQYDEIINGNNNRIADLENIEFLLQDIGSVKVVPIAGDRSQPVTLDSGKDVNPVNYEDIKISEEKALATLAIPVDLFYGQEGAGDNSKQNVRYTKKINRIKANICKVARYLALIHLAKAYPDKEFEANQIDIQLKSSVNMEELQSMEAQDLVISSTDAILGLVESIQEMVDNSDYEIDPNALVKNVKESLATISSPFKDVLVDRKSANSTPSDSDFKSDQSKPSTEPEGDGG